MRYALSGRYLYFDGESAWDPEALFSNILRGIDVGKPFVKTPETGYKVKNSCKPLPEKSWNIPVEYITLDLDKLFDGLVKGRGDIAITRTKYELALYREHGFEDVLRLMCYVRDVFIENDVVWGVGRGSSVASYLLFLLDIHIIDPIKYDLDIHDFIRT